MLVLADRGLYARWLFREVVCLGWHPFFRINRGGKVRRATEREWHFLASLVPSVGTQWHGEVYCFKSLPLPCTLWAGWGPAYADPS